MKTRRYLIVIAGLIIAIYSMKTFASVEADETWKTRMRALAASINELLPIVASDKAFSDPKQSAKLKQTVQDLSVLAKDLNQALAKHGKKTDRHASDPIFPFMSAAFQEDIETAKQVLNNGDKRYAQTLLQNSLAYCTSCHTRTENKSEFKFPVFGDAIKNLGLFERMKLLTATRQFDKALSEFNSNLTSRQLEKVDSIDLESAARLAVAIAVRVYRDPKKAIAEAETAKKIQKISPAFKEELAAWISALKEWQAKKSPTPETETALFTEGKKLVEVAQSREKSAINRSADIDYLRATALLHELIEKYPKTSHLGETLYLLGQSYSTLQQLGFWSLHELYFEACVKTAPHTDLAKKCFSEFKESYELGYTGSSGTHIPPEARRKIEALKTLAEPKTKTKGAKSV